MNRYACTAAIVIGLTLHARSLPAQQRVTAFAQEPACRSLTPTSVGGPPPRRQSTLVARWLGTANFELAYRDEVVLLDAYYDRAPRTRPLGFARDEIRRANAIFIGHGHSDHMADAAFVAGRTGARVFGGPPTIEALRKQGTSDQQAIVVRGGEIVNFNGFSVQAILARHADPAEVTRGLQIFGPALRAAFDPPLTDDEKRHAAEINQHGTADARVITEGTIAYLFTFTDGFTWIFLDSAGQVTDAERQMMNRIKRTDVASVAYQGHFLAKDQIAATLPLIKLFNPAYYIPNHHDEIAGQFWDMATYPLFMGLRDEMPRTKTIDPLYRAPICIDTVTKTVMAGTAAR